MFGYEIDVASLVNAIVDAIVVRYGNFFRDLSEVIEVAFETVVDLLLIPPEFILIGVMGLVLWKVANRRVALFGVVCLIVIALMGLWHHAVDTLVLVLFATALSLAVAFPVGIVMGISDKAAALIRPILVLMQTMPSFVCFSTT